MVTRGRQRSLLDMFGGHVTGNGGFWTDCTDSDRPRHLLDRLDGYVTGNGGCWTWVTGEGACR